MRSFCELFGLEGRLLHPLSSGIFRISIWFNQLCLSIRATSPALAGDNSLSPFRYLRVCQSLQLLAALSSSVTSHSHVKDLLRLLELRPVLRRFKKRKWERVGTWEELFLCIFTAAASTLLFDPYSDVIYGTFYNECASKLSAWLKFKFHGRLPLGELYAVSRSPTPHSLPPITILKMGERWWALGLARVDSVEHEIYSS